MADEEALENAEEPQPEADETAEGEEAGQAPEPTPDEQVIEEPSEEGRTTSRADFGLIRAIQEERRKAKESKREVERLRAELEAVKGGGDSEELMTEAKLNARIAEVREEVRDRYISASQKAAKRLHTIEKEGSGLDWNSAFDRFEEMVADNPKILDFVLNEDDPGEAMYDFVVNNDPEFKARIRVRDAAKTTKRLSKLAEEAVPSGGKASGKPAPAGDISALSDEQLEKLIKEGK